jgi:hypothetical protein
MGQENEVIAALVAEPFYFEQPQLAMNSPFILNDLDQRLI